MYRYNIFKGSLGALALAALALAVIVACGGAAPAEETGQAAPAAPTAMAAQQQAPQQPASGTTASSAQPAQPAQQAQQSQPQAAPTAVPAAAGAAPQVALEPTGKITMGQEEINIFSGHPAHSVNPQLFVISTAPVVEGLMQWNSNLEAEPLLTESLEHLGRFRDLDIQPSQGCAVPQGIR